MIYDCDTHSCLWYLNFITIPSFVCPKLACIELLISLHNDRHLFADGFVTVRPIAIKFGWDKENVSCLKFRKYTLNPTNFNRKLTMMFKLDLKNITLTAFRTPVENRLIKKVNIFCTENERLHAFYAPGYRTSYKLDEAIMLIFVSEKNRPLLLAKGVYTLFKKLRWCKSGSIAWLEMVCSGLTPHIVSYEISRLPSPAWLCCDQIGISTISHPFGSHHWLLDNYEIGRVSAMHSWRIRVVWSHPRTVDDTDNRTLQDKILATPQQPRCSCIGATAVLHQTIDMLSI